MRRGRRHVMDASGAGTTTRARAVADHWSVALADADGHCWGPSDRPSVEKRAVEDHLALMTAVLSGREAWDVDA